MPKHSKQLNPKNLSGYLSQINTRSTPDTTIKLKCRAANCLYKTGNVKHINAAIELFNEAYNIQSYVRGDNHPRTTNISLSIIKCENRLVNLKKNRM
jgi:hypothetical protein